ncbi:hypothetical protein WMY93_029867 [Mugilogobius chulae]|uniref:Reverse transcriptase n=1 Tax=Mugilogobius chulae TaxID=88201 RepID=A0AAW0MY57_9GOBI
MEAPESVDLLDLGRVGARALKEKEFAKWKDLLEQGRGVAHCTGDKTSNFWCKDPVRAGLTESEFLIALKLRSNTFRTSSEGWSSSHAESCRLCGTQRPTLAHVVSHCPNLKEQRMQNHNKICQAIKGIAESKDWSVTSEKHVRNKGRLEDKAEMYRHLDETLKDRLKVQTMHFVDFPMGAKGKWHPNNDLTLELLGLSKAERESKKPRTFPGWP